MAIFTLLFLKMIPLYVMMGIGFLARQLLDVERESISKTLIYLIVPCVFFSGAMHTPFTLELLVLIPIVVLMSSALSLLFYRIGGRHWQDSTTNLLAFTAGNANTGYFGLPVALMILSDEGVGIYLTLMIGVIIFESTLGFYIAARGNYTVKDAVNKLLRLPSLYAFMLGAILHSQGVNMPEMATDFFIAMRGTYSVLGMMVIGMGLVGLSIKHIDLRFIGLAFLAKFVGYPLLACMIVFLDRVLIHVFSSTMHDALLLISLMPLAANSVVFATLLGVQPEKAATSVFLSTLFALVYLPLMIALLIK